MSKTQLSSMTAFLLSATACTGTVQLCDRNSDCGAGQVCISGGCEKLCSADSECESGSICDSGSLCVAGSRTDRPEISAINGDGSPDGRDGYGSNRIASGIIVIGANLQGASLRLEGESTYELPITSPGDRELGASLPPELAPGTYLVVAYNQAGSDSGTITLLQGEPGPRGPTGPQGEAGLAGPPGPLQQFTNDTEFTIPGDQTTLHSALTFLDDWLIAADTTVTLRVTQAQSYTTPVTVSHRDGARIRIIGDTSTPIELTFDNSNAFVVTNGGSLGLLDGFVISGTNGANVGVYAAEDSFIRVGSSVTVQGFTNCIFAYGQSRIRANDVTITGCNNGIYALRSSSIEAHGATISNTSNYGVHSNEDSLVTVYNSTITTTASHGLLAQNHSSIMANNSTVTGAGTIGASAVVGSTIRCQNCVVQNSANQGLYAASGSFIYAYRAKSNNNGSHGAQAISASGIEIGGTAALPAELRGNGAYGARASSSSYIRRSGCTITGNASGDTLPAAGSIDASNGYID